MSRSVILITFPRLALPMSSDLQLATGNAGSGSSLKGIDMRPLLALAVMAIITTTSSFAADGTPSRVRGTIEQATDKMLMVKSREGQSVSVALSDGYQVRGVKAAAAEDIKAGDYVGVASLPTSAGGNGALEVLIFPAAMKGVGQGSFPWDLQPNSTMTNATVSNAVTNVDGRSLTLSYPEGEKVIALAPGIPVVTFADAAKSDLVAGTTVFVPATRDDAGMLTTKFVVVGKNGVVPPM